MAKAKAYRSVREMVKDTTSEEFSKEFERRSKQKKLSRALSATRNGAGITQKEMAEILGCGQGRISKLEHADNAKVCIGDMEAYGKACGFEISIMFHPHMKAMDWVKFHALALEHCLNKIVELVGDDEAMTAEARSFIEREVPANLSRIVRDCAKALPAKKEPPRPESVIEVGTYNPDRTDCVLEPAELLA